MFRLHSGRRLETINLGNSAVKNPIVRKAMPNVDEMNALQPQPFLTPAQLDISAAIDSPRKIIVPGLAKMSVS